MHKEDNDIRDIYQAEERDPEKDFNPQITPEFAENRQRDFRKDQRISALFGLFAIALSIVLITIVVLDFQGDLKPFRKPVSEAPVDAARDVLPKESLSIMDYPAEPTESGESPGAKPFSSQWVKTAAYYTISGQQALSFNRHEEALSNFKRVVDIYPDIEGIHATIGALHLFRKEYSNAVPYLEKSLQEEETFDAVNNLGNAYVGTKQYDLAQKNLKRALELAPENPGCHKNLATLYQKMKRENDAIFHFEKYLDMLPDDLETKQAYALYLTELKRWKNAEEVLSELTKQVTDIAPLYFLLAQAQIQNGQTDKVIDSLKQGALLTDPQLALTWLRRDEFNAVRNTASFKQLSDQLKRSAE